ncbi:hypothetical protein Tco_0929161 [Tanacetum coccineum]
MDEDQAGPDPGISRVALARPDLEPTYGEFMANLYPKNLEDAYAIGDQFINEKSTDDEPEKINVEAEVVSMVTVPIYQASSLVPPLSIPVIDLSPPEPAPSTTQTLVFTTTTSTTTTTHPLPPPPQQQSTINSELAARVTSLEQKFAAFEQKSKNLDNTTQNLGSRVFTLELRDLTHKIDEVVRENVKEANISHYMKLLRHIWNGHRGTNSLLNGISLARDDVMIKTLLLLHQILIQVRKKDMTLALQAHHSLQLHSHLPGSQLTLEMLLQARSSNNLANALASTYQAPAENYLLEKTRDMRTFMNWYCQKIGKTKLTQADLEDQIDWANLEGDQVRIDISRPLPLSGPPGVYVGVYVDYVGVGTQSIERDRLIGIGVVLDKLFRSLIE